MTGTISEEIAADALCGASAFQQLHWLASGRATSDALTAAYRAEIERRNAKLNAYVALDDGAVAAAEASAARRREGQIIGRLDGLAVAIKDNIDVAGLPTRVGLARRARENATDDASVVARLRAAGAVVLGKTALDEGALGTTTRNPGGSTSNPHRAGFTAGGSSGGSAAAVAAGLASFAIGTDTLGSIRIPASHSGVFGLRPTLGEISTRGVVHAARRLDTVGILARSVQDLAIVLQVLAGYDERDPRSRRRRVPLATPDWEPRALCTGVIADATLSAIGVDAGVRESFANAVAALERDLGERSTIDFDGYDFARMRRAGLLVMESELALELKEDLDACSPRLRAMIEFARGKSAVDYAAADRMIDSALLHARRLFASIDVLLMPTVPHGPYALDEDERANDAELTAFASLAGCPAVTLPMGLLPDDMPSGLQLVGAPGSELRLLELAEIAAATLDAAPAYPVGR